MQIEVLSLSVRPWIRTCMAVDGVCHEKRYQIGHHIPSGRVECVMNARKGRDGTNIL